jgi:hypothetical protein
MAVPTAEGPSAVEPGNVLLSTQGVAPGGYMGFRTGIHIEAAGLQLDQVITPAAAASLSVILGTA